MHETEPVLLHQGQVPWQRLEQPLVKIDELAHFGKGAVVVRRGNHLRRLRSGKDTR